MKYHEYFENALIAGRDIIDIKPETIVAVLRDLAEAVVGQTDHLLLENQKTWTG